MIGYYFETDIDAPRDDRRLSISTVNRQMYNDSRQMCAVNFNRNRGGTVLQRKIIVEILQDVDRTCLVFVFVR